VESRRLTLITGGSRGIGHHLVQSYLADTDVLNVSRKPARSAIRQSRHELHNLSLDLADVMLIEPCLRAWLDEHPHYSVTRLIHNAAVLNLGYLDQLSSADFDRSFQVNVHAPLTITATLHRAGRISADGARVA